MAAAALTPAISAAQQQSDASPPINQLEEIVVTARRTAESLQDTPVAVTALTGNFLEQQNILDATGLSQFTPNLSLIQQSTSLTAASLTIRGIGNAEPAAIAEQAVGVYLDGVYIARSAGAIFDLVDLERVEVLRGPQGTLFGRNTIGGAVQLVSRKPADEFGFEAKGGYSRYNDWYARGRIDTGIIAGSPFHASLSYQHRQRDGYINNLLTPDDKDPGAINGDALFLAVRGDFGSLVADYTFDYSDRRGSSPFFQTVAATPDVINYFSQSPLFGGPPFQFSQDRLNDVQQVGFINRFGDLQYGARAKIQGHALTLEYEATDDLTLKSISSYRKFFQDTVQTLSGQGPLLGVVLDPVTFAPSIQPVGLFNGNNAPQKQWQFSQELQALGNFDQWNYVLGAYYFYEKSSEFNRQALTFVLPGGQAGINLTPIQSFGGTSESFAVFGQLSYRPPALDDRLELTGGLRYTWDNKTVFLAGDLPFQTGQEDFTNVSWLASASYDITDDLMVYGRVATGFRSGGFSPRAVVIAPFDPEKVLAYEAGLKAELFDRRLRANLALFYTDYDDQQIQQFEAGSGGVTARIVNAGKVAFKGIELEVTAVPFERLTLDGSLGYTDPDYKEFLFRDPLTNQLINVADEVRLGQAPKFNAHAGAEYRVPIGVGEISARVDYSYRSRIYWFALDRVNQFNREISSPHDHNLRARLALSDIDVAGGKFEVGVWGDNLTNQENIDFGIDFGALGFGGASFKKPRTFGVDAKFSY